MRTGRGAPSVHVPDPDEDLFELRVNRAAHRWPVGYFQLLVGQRIAFQREGRTQSGILRRVEETSYVIDLWLSDLGGVDELVGDGF